MSLELAYLMAAYDATYTAVHSNADSILMLPLVPFRKLLGMQSVHNTAMLLHLPATALNATQNTKSWARD